MIKYTQEELCLIWLDSFLGLEYRHKKNIYEFINGKEGILEVISKAKDYIVNQIGEKEYNTIKNSANKSYLDYVLQGLTTRGIKAVTINSSEYPEKLKNTSIPPLVLYAKGDTKLLNERSFAIVGSRRSLPQSIKLAQIYASELIDAGFVMVTGIAEGIDCEVLKTAVNKGAKAISVVGGGFDRIYPSSNVELANKIAETGLLLSESPPQTIARPFHFPVRNRIIAGLSDGVLVVSGRLKSGTLYTAEYAEEYGKDLFAIPYTPGVESGEGCNDLIKCGALLTDTPKDILNFYKIEVKEAPSDLSDQEKGIIDVLGEGQMHAEKICEKLNKRIFEITPILSMLEMKGVIVKSGNVYGLAVNRGRN